MIDRIYKVYCYWRIHGTAALRQLIFRKAGYKVQLHTEQQLLDLMPSNNRAITAAQISQTRFQAVTPLRTYFLPESQTRRVNIVTDSVSGGSLFGGVGTALIFAALLANKLSVPLRIVTRTERAKPENVDHLLSLYGIKLEHEIQFKFAAFYDQKYEIDIVKGDLFITTSWWTTAATLPSVPNEDVVYLLQEDERMFYPFGDDRLRCEAILRNRDIRFLINTKLLFDHLVHDGFDNIAAQGEWFEPAFPSQIYYPRPRGNGGKRKFFFYARPNNLRNLFYLGLDVIEHAITEQVLNLEHWDIYLVGKDIPTVTFNGGYSPIKCENFSWSEYAELIGTVDLGLSLMYTPHPSYPPLDLVASGAVVVTNRFANKHDLSGYSENLICADIDRDALVAALSDGVALALDSNERERNYRSNGLLTDWQKALDEIIQQISREH